MKFYNSMKMFWIKMQLMLVVVLIFLLHSGVVLATVSNEKTSVKYNQKKSLHSTSKNTIKVFLSDVVVVNHEKYTLADIAELEGTSFRTIEKLKKVVIGRSPLPGKSLKATKSLITSKLRKYLKKKQLVFPKNNLVLIQRSALKISGTEIDKVVLNYIEEQYSNNEIKPKLLSKSRDIFLPKGELDYKIQLLGKYKKEGGQRNYSINFLIDEKVVKKVIVRVYLKVYKEIYVAKDTIKKNQFVEERDLIKVRRNVDRLPSAYITDKQQVVGKLAKRVISPKEVIKKNIVDHPPLIKSGDRLTIVFESSSLRFTAPGIALAKGKQGQKIAVRNLDSESIVYAHIKSKNFVMIQ